ncbi:MAG TPA: hypothetical protein VHJ18_06155 [Streptosporangiaceae bacterium]|nr:hypothetical protein [Streptosporangiaceae bacterium]
MNQPVRSVVPAGIVKSVQRRLARLGPEAADVVTTAAVLGSEFDVSLLGDLAGVGELAAVNALNLASGVQLVESRSGSQEEFRFRHSLIRDAIVSDLRPPDRAARSGRAAAAIELAHPNLPGSWCELAVDMHDAAGETVKAAELRLELGRRALQSGAFASATDVLTTARTLLEGARSVPDRLLVDVDNAIVRAFELTGDTDRLIPAADRLIAGLDRIGADQLWKAHVHIRMARAFSEVHPGRTSQHLSMARAIADSAQDQALTARLDAVAARCALDADRPETAIELANRSLAPAETAGLRGWAGETGFEALETIGRWAQLNGDLRTAADAFERAHQIATTERRPILRIRAKHQIGIAQVLESGATRELSEARDLAARAGAISTIALIDLQLATAWSVGPDLDRALNAARSCQRTAGRIRQRRVEAMAWCVQAAIAGIRRDPDETERAVGQAELTLPDDPEVLLVTWGQARAAASLFANDISRARAECNKGIRYGRTARQRAPRYAWGFWALLEAISDQKAQAALEEARAQGAIGSFNQGFLGYADAVLQGRDGHADRATALAEEASRNLAAFAPWWNHLARRLVAPYALEHRWGEPVAWLRSAVANFQKTGHAELAATCQTMLRESGAAAERVC